MLDVQKLQKSVCDHISDRIARQELSGTSARVYESGNLVFQTVQGFADPDKKIKLNEGHLFRMASMTKPVTAAAVLLAQEDGLLSIEDPVGKYVPELAVCRVADENGAEIPGQTAQIMIYHLLTHTSGIRDDKPTGTEYDVSSLMPYYAGQTLQFLPGTKKQYSGTTAFDVLAEIVKRVTGMPFEDYIRTRIFEPLSMRHSYFYPHEIDYNNLVAMTDRKDGKTVTVDYGKGTFCGNMPLSYHSGGAGLISCIEDYSQFALMLLGNGTLNGVQVMNPESVELMRTIRLPARLIDASDNWGLGVRVIYRNSDLPDGSFGWSGAFGTHFWVDPVNRICAIYMKNSLYDGGAGASSSVEFERDVMAALK